MLSMFRSIVIVTLFRYDFKYPNIHLKISPQSDLLVLITCFEILFAISKVKHCNPNICLYFHNLNEVLSAYPQILITRLYPVKVHYICTISRLRQFVILFFHNFGRKHILLILIARISSTPNRLSIFILLGIPMLPCVALFFSSSTLRHKIFCTH